MRFEVPLQHAGCSENKEGHVSRLH